LRGWAGMGAIPDRGFGVLKISFIYIWMAGFVFYLSLKEIDWFQVIWFRCEEVGSRPLMP
jgi:hypothetical protein